MRQSLLLLSLTLLAARVSSAAGQDQTKPPESLREKASYVMGRDLVRDFQDRLVDFDVEQLIAGIRDAAANTPSVLSEEDMSSVMTAFGKELELRQQEKIKELADKNMRAGQEFMKANALKDGVKQLENGLQYTVLEKGTGSQPQLEDRVKIHIVGKDLADKVFESTRTANEPAVVSVGGIGVRGIVEVLLRMPVGSKWMVVVPPDLAYGVPGAPPDIEPNQTLVFEIELLEIVK